MTCRNTTVRVMMVVVIRVILMIMLVMIMHMTTMKMADMICWNSIIEDYGYQLLSCI